MTSILIAGATGLVGSQVLKRALEDARVDWVVAPTRRQLPTHPKLNNPVTDLDPLPTTAEWWSVDSVICALGTTRAKAGSDEAFRAVDFAMPLAIAGLTRERGATRFALISSMGANAHSRLLYLRTKGEVEEAIKQMAFPSFTIVRPGLLMGKRKEFRLGERVTGAVLSQIQFLLPRPLRGSPAAVVAEALLEAALSGPPGLHVITADKLAARPA